MPGPAPHPPHHYTAPNIACDECGAGPGEPCLPHCLAPFAPGGPYEHHDPAECDRP